MRARNVPARLVAGFVPSAAHRGEFRGADATVWVELDLAGAGWVPLMIAPPEREQADAGPAPPPPSSVPEPSTISPPRTPAPAPSESAPARRRWSPALITTAAVAGTGCLYLASVLVLPIVRRLRRRLQRNAAASIAGAWHELLEVMPPEPPPAFAIPSNLPARSRHAGAVPFAALVNRALFDGAPLTRTEVRTAWPVGRELRRELLRQQPRRRRLGRRLAPGRLALSTRYRPDKRIRAAVT
jgi:hypothetical protein